MAAPLTPGQLILTNQFGEESFNTVGGLLLVGATAPVDGTTGDNVSPKGGFYVALDTGVAYQNSGTISAPVWTALAGGANTTGAYSEAAPSLTFDHSVGALACVVRQVGKQVFLTVPAGAFADGLGTVVASTALATGLRPAAAITAPILVIDAGTTRKIGQVVIATSGVLTISVLGAAFTNAQAGGWDRFCVSYPLA